MSTETKTYSVFVKTSQGYWGLGNTIAEALKNAKFTVSDKVRISFGKNIVWTEEGGVVADEWTLNNINLGKLELDSRDIFDMMHEKAETVRPSGNKARIEDMLEDLETEFVDNDIY